MDLLARRSWIFDMDGTLTVPVHDFDAIRAELGLPPGPAILEAISALPEHEAVAKRARLDEIEHEIVAQATPMAGAAELLQALCDRGVRLGILTRNTLPAAFATLQACGLSSYFERDHVLGRDCAVPKPSPEGIRELLSRWGSDPSDGVMVGDYLFDLQAGRAAGVATVYFDSTAAFPYAGEADLQFSRLSDLLHQARTR